MNRLTLGVHERQRFVESLRRREPLKGRGRRRGFEDNQEGGSVGERNDEVVALDWVGVFRERKWQIGFGFGVEDRENRERPSVERDWTSVRVGEREESRSVDCGGREIEVERERDVGGEWVSRIGERVRINRCH